MFSPQRITRVTAIALTAGAIAAPVASARPARMAPNQAVAAISVSQERQLSAGNASAPHRTVSAARPAAPGAYTRQDKQLAPTSASQAPVASSAPASTASESFDWGDAGIGAAGGLAISIGIGGALVLSQRRLRRTRPTAVAAS